MAIQSHLLGSCKQGPHVIRVILQYELALLERRWWRDLHPESQYAVKLIRQWIVLTENLYAAAKNKPTPCKPVQSIVDAVHNCVD